MSVAIDCKKLKALHKNADKTTQKAIEAMAPELFAQNEFPALMRSRMDADKLVYFTKEKVGIVVHRNPADKRKIGKESKKFAMKNFISYDA